MDMTMPQPRHGAAGRGRHEAGSALVSVLMLSVLALILTAALATLITTGMSGASFARSSEIAYTMARAGVNATIFQIEASTNPSSGAIGIETYLANSLGAANAGTARPGTKQFTGTLTGGSYAVTLSDPSAADNILTLTSVGKDQSSGRTRTVVAILKAEPVVALNYAMFGNEIRFHNHNKVAYGVTLNTSLFSNGSILIDRGISILGPAEAVNAIQPNTGPASGTVSLPNTILSPAGKQGDPNPMTSDDAPVVQAVPAPQIQAYPTFDFATAQSTASAAGRELTPGQLTTLINNAQTFADGLPVCGTPCLPTPLPAASYPAGVSAATVPVNVTHYQTSAANPHPRDIRVPNGTNPDAYVPLGSPSTSATQPTNPATDTNLYEIAFVGNPLSDTMLYVKGGVTLMGPTTTLLQFQGALTVNGPLEVHTPLEVLAWHNRTGPNFVPLGQSLYTDANGNSTVAKTLAEAAAGQPYDVIYSHWPAIAANGGIKFSSSSGGQGGPVHIEGAVYTVAESHFHKSDPFESSYSVGSEIADVIHNCQFFSFAYDPQAKTTIGFFNKAAGREKLQVIRLEDRP